MSEKIESAGPKATNVSESVPPVETPEGERKPELIIDFIRHGTTAYGPALEQKLRDIGQDPEIFTLMPAVDGSIEDAREQLEGRVTQEGEEGLRESIRELCKRIDPKKEIVAIAHGTRTRHEQSTDIIADELRKNGIDVVRVKPHKNLVDVQGGGWYSFVDYIMNHQGKTEADLEAFWWEMYQDEETRSAMNAAGYENLADVAKRTEYFVEILRRFVRRHALGKTLRVIAVTSDVNIEQIQQAGIPMEERNQIWPANAEIYEVGFEALDTATQP
ncbi:MAG: hypothetical protein V4480_02895 [Patescibacteria group bacterium]